jgi:hypothetical protein
VPAPASADYQDVIRDCADDGKLNGRYSQEDLRRAEDNLPSDIDEYTPCADVIAAAIRSGGPGSSSGPREGTTTGVPTPSGAIAQTRDDVASLQSAKREAQQSGDAPVTAGGQTLRPAAGRIDGVAGAANELPVPLLVAIAAVLGLCLVGGLVAARRRMRDIARGPLRIIRR